MCKATPMRRSAHHLKGASSTRDAQASTTAILAGQEHLSPHRHDLTAVMEAPG
jgi:hypothetical protein